MIKKMLLDDTELHITPSDLPLLIHGEDGYGASLFSVSIMADLYTQGRDIVFLCGFQMARDEFEQQTESRHDSIIVSQAFTPESIASKRVIYVPSEQPKLLGQVLNALDNSSERIIFFKNFDLFDESIFAVAKSHANLVMMGNIDNCDYKTELLTTSWSTRIYFSIPKTEVNIKIPELEKYSGYLNSRGRTGITSLVTDDNS